MDDKLGLVEAVKFVVEVVEAEEEAFEVVVEYEAGIAELREEYLASLLDRFDFLLELILSELIRYSSNEEDRQFFVAGKLVFR